MKPNAPTKFNYLYKIVCSVSNKYYYGIHSTNKLNDSYMGSGKIILASLKKHGRSAHIKIIMAYFNTRKELSDAEAVLVTEQMLQDPLCMNLKTGGDNDSTFSQTTLLKMKKTPAQRAAISARRRGRATFVTEEQRSYQAARVSGEGNGMYGRPRTPEWRAEHSAKMKILMKGKRLGISNLATLGSRWFHNLETNENKMIKGDPPEGWIAGRKFVKPQ